MKKTTNTGNKTTSESRALVNRRDYLRLAGTAGVAGVGISTLAGQVRAEDLKRTLTLEGPGSLVRYGFSVEGEVVKSTAMGASISGEDIISNGGVSGAVVSGRDSYSFTGMLTTFNNDGPLTYYLNGEQLLNTLTIEDNAGNGDIPYAFRVDGEVLKSPAMAATISAEDTISGRTADDGLDISRPDDALVGETLVSGAVDAGRDSYAYSGEITSFGTNGDIDVYVNGELVDPAQFTPDILTIEGTGTYSSYEFTVSTDLRGFRTTQEDTISGNTASGAVRSSYDSYEFTGDIVDLDINGDATARLNGEALDPADFSMDSLSIEGTGPYTPYEFSVSGDLEERYGLNREDTISGSSATGAVGGGTDSYAFTGEVLDFTMDGSAAVYLNGEEVDPALLGNPEAIRNSDLPNLLTINGLAGGARVDYGFGVTGELANGETADGAGGDDPSNSYGRGFVLTGIDTYHFSGEVASITDFETFDISIHYDRGEIHIENYPSNDRTDYEITVSGVLSGKNTNQEDSTSGGTATGAVGSGTDVYEFSGALLGITIQDRLDIGIDYPPVNGVLGDFETGLDDWETSDTNQLARVKSEDHPAIISDDAHVLKVDTSGSAIPIISNTRRVSRADFKQSPYLVADITSMFEETNVDVVFKLRYHRTDEPDLVVESPEVPVAQLLPGSVYWDMSNLPDAALSNPERLEIIWYPADQPPESDSSDYQGRLLINNIRITGDVQELTAKAIPTKMGTYAANHATIRDTIVDNETDGFEEGRFVFSDGTERSYTYEKVGDGKYEYTIDGEVFKRGGGW